MTDQSENPVDIEQGSKSNQSVRQAAEDLRQNLKATRDQALSALNRNENRLANIRSEAEMLQHESDGWNTLARNLSEILGALEMSFNLGDENRAEASSEFRLQIQHDNEQISQDAATTRRGPSW